MRAHKNKICEIDNYLRYIINTSRIVIHDATTHLYLWEVKYFHLDGKT